jgi:hypothetical protein
LGADDRGGLGAALDRAEEVAASLRAVAEVNALDCQQQGTVERGLDQRLSSDAPCLGDRGLLVGTTGLSDGEQAGHHGNN